MVVPIPFLLLYVSVVASGGFGGKLAGAASGVLAGAYVVFAGMVDFGPQALTGGAGQIMLGVLLYAGSGYLAGRIRSHREDKPGGIQGYEDEFKSDIHARTDELGKSEETFRSLAEHALDIITILDADGTIRFESPSFKTVLGFEPEEVVGRNALELIHRDDLEVVKAALAQIMEAPGRSGSVEFRARREDGTWCHLEAVGRNQVEDPAVRGIVVHSRDITGRKEAEEALRRSEANFRKILDNMQETFYRTDLAGRIVMASPSAEKLLGYKVEELIGMELATLYADAEQRAAFLSELKKSGGNLVGYESHLRGKNGDEIWVSTNAQYYRDGEGKVLGVEGTTRDVTERRNAEQALHASEARFRDLSESASDWFWEMDADLRFVYLSDSIGGYLGRPGDASMGKTREEIYADVVTEGTPEEQENWRLHFADLRARRPFRNFVQPWTTPAGETRYCVNNGKPYFHEDGTFAGYRGTATDITESVLAERKLRRNQAEAARQMEVVTTLIDTLPAHISLRDRDGDFIFVNQTMARDYGRDKSDFVGRKLDDVGKPVVGPNLQTLTEKVIRTDEPVRNQVFSPPRFPERTFLTNIMPMHGDDGEVDGALAISLDISDRTQAEEALRKSEERFRSLVEGSVQGVIIHRNLKIVFANPAVTELFGYTESAEILDLVSVHELFWPDEIERVEEYRKRRLRGEVAPSHYEFKGRKRDGSMVWLDNLVRTIEWEGEPAFQLTLSDITDRKQVENALRESEERFRQLAEGSVQGIMVHQGDFKALYANDAYARIFGYENAAEILNLPSIDKLFAPYELARMESYAAKRMAGETPTSYYQYEGRKKDGSPLWLENFVTITEWQGEAAIQTTVVDISERKRAEEALRASEARLSGVLDIAPDAIITTDEQGNIRMFNQGARVIFGYQEEEVLGRSVEILIPERFRQDHPRQMAEFGASKIQSKRMSERRGVFGIRKDGSDFAAEASISRLDLGDGTLFNVILRDVSERRRIEQEVLQAKELAEAASSAKSDFLANMSHELRTPLNAILGFSEVMAEESFGPLENEKYKEYVGDIHTSGILLLDLINDVLDLSRVEAGVIDLNEGLVDLNEAVIATLRLVRERAARKSLRIETNFDPASPIIRGDERAIKQISLNLLSNCTKFTREGGEITVGSGLDEDGGVFLTVADTGIGIAAADIPKVLEPFGQIGGAHTREHQGTGLGLPFAKRLAEMHDATFELESKPGVGTTVTLRFPPERLVE